MDRSSWAYRPRPAPGPRLSVPWHGQPATPGELSRLRGRLRAALADGSVPAGADGGERLLLAVEELASNGLRHGGQPVQVTVTAAGSGWLLEVSDTAPARQPTPAIGRDAALGGMGLGLVARLSSAHGWTIDGDRKIVWAQIPFRTRSDPPAPTRIRTARIRARALLGCLAVTQAQLAATLQRLSVDAAGQGRPEMARAYRAAARRAHADAVRARQRAQGSPGSTTVRVTTVAGTSTGRAPRPHPPALSPVATARCDCPRDR